MKISNKGLELLKQFEGLYLKAYKDIAGIWTIGYGTIKYPNGDKVQAKDTCNEEQATRWLEFEVNEKSAYFNQVIQRINLELNQNQYDAICSFLYNVGIGKCYPNTTMGDALISCDHKKIADAFLVYNKYTGLFGIKRISKGLDRRRKAEKALYES